MTNFEEIIENTTFRESSEAMEDETLLPKEEIQNGPADAETEKPDSETFNAIYYKDEIPSFLPANDDALDKGEPDESTIDSLRNSGADEPSQPEIISTKPYLKQSNDPTHIDQNGDQGYLSQSEQSGLEVQEHPSSDTHQVLQVPASVRERLDEAQATDPLEFTPTHVVPDSAAVQRIIKNRRGNSRALPAEISSNKNMMIVSVYLRMKIMNII